MGLLLFCIGGYIGVSTFVLIDQNNYIKYLENREKKKDLINEDIRS